MFRPCVFLLLLGLISIGLCQDQFVGRRRQRKQREDLLQQEIVRPKVYEVQRQISPNVGDGNFQYYSAMSDGHESEQQGHFNKPSHSQVHQGSYTTNDEHGQVVRIDYIADKDGFRPIGQNGAALLPTPPPIPLEHIKAREDILRQQKEIRDQHLAYFRNPQSIYG